MHPTGYRLNVARQGNVNRFKNRGMSVVECRAVVGHDV